jgi:hypothetical protein
MNSRGVSTFSSSMVIAIPTHAEIKAPLLELLDKYNSLVWYARSSPPGDPYWIGTPQDDCKRAFAEQKRIELSYPAEVSKVSADDNWNHGFNSGCLAAFRLALELIESLEEKAAVSSESDEDDEEGSESPVRCIADIVAEFPDLDT